MLIGIDASRAFLKRRTGIEEYAYQTIKHLRGVVSETDTVFLYVRKKLAIRRIAGIPEIDFKLPKNWKVKGIWAPRRSSLFLGRCFGIGQTFCLFQRTPCRLFIQKKQLLLFMVWNMNFAKKDIPSGRVFI